METSGVKCSEALISYDSALHTSLKTSATPAFTLNSKGGTGLAFKSSKVIAQFGLGLVCDYQVIRVFKLYI